MYAVIVTGGKQYRVSEGDVVFIEKLPAEVGETVTFDKVELVSANGDLKIGTPYVDGAKVNAIECSYASDVDYKIDEKTTDITVCCKAALPEYSDDEKKSFAISGLFQAYFLQLNDMVEDYYDFIEVDETEDGE